MAPVWLQGPLLTLALLFSGECYAQGHNPSRKYCGGARQSPIDIPKNNRDKIILARDMGPVQLTGYGDSQKLLKFRNIGVEVSIELGDGLDLRGYGLPSTYSAKTVRFHWGNGNSKPGSEHYLGGRQYAMELQIYHFKKGLYDILGRHDGIAALGFFVHGHEEAKGKTAEAWKALTDLLPNISTKGQYIEFNGTSPFSLMDLLGSINLARYYRYYGSLTGDDCDEVVIWTIFADPILVPPEVVEAFPKRLYSTSSSSGPHLESNFRPLQPIWERVVDASAALKEEMPVSASSLDAQPAKFFLLLFITLTFFLTV